MTESSHLLLITSADRWREQWSSSVYRPPELELQGFVACNLPADIDRHLERRGELWLLLRIDADKLHAEVRDAEGLSYILGPINREAIVSVVPLGPQR
jgi:uncharacterized protein (DUF952 family)